MDLRFFLIFFVVYIGTVGGFEGRSDLRRHEATKLAKWYLKSSAEPEDLEEVRLNCSVFWSQNVTQDGALGSLLKHAGHNYVFTGNRMLQLRNDGGSSSGYSLSTTNYIGLENDVVFVRKAEFNGILMFVVCHQPSYCQVLMWRSTSQVPLKQTIDTLVVPSDVRFFVDDDDLYLIVVKDPCTLYRWTGTYFDKHDELDTNGASDVAVFKYDEDTIMVVAQNLPDKKVYSKVFIRKNRKVELVQLLSKGKALKATTFQVQQGLETLDFVLLVDADKFVSVFWWTGSELALWSSLNDASGPHQIFVCIIQSRTFVMLYADNHVLIYHPTATTFDLVQTLYFDHQEVVSLEVHEAESEKPVLMVLTKSTSFMDSFLKVVLIAVDISVVPAKESTEQRKLSSLVQCFLDLEERLRERDRKISEMMSLSAKIPSKDEPGELDEISASVVFLNQTTIDQLEVTPPGEKVEITATEASKRLDSISSRIVSLRSLQKPNGFHVKGDLVVEKLKANRLTIGKLNGRNLDIENWLSTTKNQTFTAGLNVRNLSVDVINAPSINHVPVEDLLVRNREVQYVTGEKTFWILKAANVRFGKVAKINGMKFADLVTSDNFVDTVIRGKKTFSKLKVNNLKVENINKMPFKEWISKVIPNSQEIGQKKVLNVSKLQVQNLTVSTVNGIPWNDFVESLYLRTENVTMTDWSVDGPLRVRNLTTKKINGIPVDDFLTKTTAQTVECTIRAPSMKVANMDAQIVNNQDGSYLDQIMETRYNGTTRLKGRVEVAEIVLKNPAKLSGVVVNVDEFKDGFWRTDLNQTINVPVNFTQGLVIGDLNATAINGETVDSFIRIDRPNVITTPLVFDDLHVLGNVTFGPGAKQNVNLRSLNRTAVKSTGENRISGRITFGGKLTTSELFVRSINEVNLSKIPLRGMELDLTGAEELSKLTVHGDVEVSKLQVGRLNNVHFDETIKKAAMLDDPLVLSYGRYQSVIVKNVNAKYINGVNVDGNKNNSRLSEKKLYNVVIDGDLQVPSIQLQKLNGIDFDDYISQVVLKNSSRVIKGEKTFEGKVTVRGNLRGRINGYSLSRLQKIALSKTKAQKVTGKYRAKQLIAKNVRAAFVDGVDMSKVIYKNEQNVQVIDGDVIFRNIKTEGNLDVKNFMNNCDLSRITKADVKSFKNFDSVDVRGDLTWEQDNKAPNSLSHFFSNAVTKNSDQVISGPVAFMNDVTLNDFDTMRNPNDIDLGFIVDDAIYTSPEVQKISRDVTFNGNVKTKNILILGDALVDEINGIDILKLNKSIVRNGEDVKVTGRKEFLSGFSATHLFAESINDLNTSQIVFYDDLEEDQEIVLPPTNFASLKIINDLRVANINGVNLNRLLSQRASKSRSQTISGKITIKGDLRIEGETSITSINDVNMDDTILIDGENTTRVIHGDIIFEDSIFIAGKLEVETFNGHNLTDLHARALMTDSDATIEGNVIFTNVTEIIGDLDALTVNGYDMQEISRKANSFQPKYVQSDLSLQLEADLEVLSNWSALPKPLLFMHLEHEQKLSLNLTAVHGSNLIQYQKDDMDLTVFGTVDKGNCGLKSECVCQSQVSMRIDENSTIRGLPGAILPPNDFSRAFKYFDGVIGVEVVVTTTTLSYSTRCKRSPEELKEEFTSISWRTTNESMSGGFSEYSTHEEKIFGGFVSDVKFFRLGESVFIVIAFHFDPTKDTNNVPTQVLELSKSNITKVDELPSKGAQVLEVFWTKIGIILVIGNSFDSELNTDNVDCGIYKFDEFKNKFELMRLIKTHGVLSIKSLRHKKDSFIFFVQKQEWPVIALKYNHEDKMYQVMQRLDTKLANKESGTLSVTVISTEGPGCDGDVFVAAVLPQNKIRLFKYKYIEGFVEELELQIPNAKILEPFRFKSKHYLMVGSAPTGSAILRLVTQGQC